MDEIFEAIKAGHSRNRKAPVGLADILERYDASQRALLTQRELDSSLRRLTESGAIRDVGNRMFVADTPTSPDTYTPLTEAEYSEAVRQYRDEFADNVAWLMRLPFFRGLSSPYIDADHVAVSFVLERVVDRFGGQIGDVVGREPLNYPVSLPAEADREAFVQEARAALNERSLSGRETWVMFPDAVRAQVAGRK